MRFIIEIHKLCLYGDVKLFEQLSSNIDIDNYILKYNESMNYCISKGAYLNKFFFDLLCKYRDKPFYVDDDIYTQLYGNYYSNSNLVFINKCNIDFNIKSEIHEDVDIIFDDTWMDEFDVRLFDLEDQNINLVSVFGIIYFDKYIFNLFLDNDYVSHFYYDYTEHDILSNTDLAMYLYSKGLHVDLCLSRFLVVDFERASKLVKKDTFFVFFISTPKICYNHEFDDLDMDLKLVNLLDYKQTMLIFFYIILYSKTLYTIKDEFIEKFDFVEYNILRLVRFYNGKEDNEKIDKLLKTRKIVKLFDISSKQYLYEEINDVENISEYEYKCLIHNLNF